MYLSIQVYSPLMFRSFLWEEEVRGVVLEPGADFSGMVISYDDLPFYDGSSRAIKNADLRGADFSNVEFMFSESKKSIFDGVSFWGCDLRNVDFTQIVVNGMVNFKDCDLRKAVFTEKRPGVKGGFWFDYSDMRGTVFKVPSTNFYFDEFSNRTDRVVFHSDPKKGLANLVSVGEWILDAKIKGKEGLSGVGFSGLKGNLDFSGLVLKNTLWGNTVKLKGANFEGCDLRGADIDEDSSFRNCNFENADLRSVSVVDIGGHSTNPGIIFEGSFFDGALMDDDFRDVIEIENGSLI